MRCALYLCSTSNMSSETAVPPGSIPCPLCRHGITSFVKIPISLAKETVGSLGSTLSLCTPCILHPESNSPTSRPVFRKARVGSISSDLFCPVTCGPFPLTSTIPSMCSCSDGPCLSCEAEEEDGDDTTTSSPRQAQAVTTMEQDKTGGGGRPRIERTCSNMFWGRRSCSREQQCNSEINA